MECWPGGAPLVLNNRFVPWLGGAALTGSGILLSPPSGYLFAGLMLFWPLIDRQWRVPVILCNTRNIAAWVTLALILCSLLVWQPRYLGFAASTLLLAALPEEWFFRAYFMTRLGMGWRTNLMTSLLFALLHGLTWGPTTGILVFLPSLFFGWLYQRTRDIILLTAAHTLSNLIFILFIADSPFITWMKHHAV